MKAETKFDIGTYVFTMYNNRIVNAKIDEIKIIICEATTPCSKPIVWYKLEKTSYGHSETFEVNEGNVFATKDELIQFLLKN